MIKTISLALPKFHYTGFQPFCLPVSPLFKSHAEIFHLFQKRKKFLKPPNAIKVHGPDGEFPQMLKDCASEFSSVLAFLFCRCTSSTVFPSSWKRVVVYLVPTVGDRSNPSNCRPITLTACV